MCNFKVTKTKNYKNERHCESRLHFADLVEAGRGNLLEALSENLKV